MNPYIDCNFIEWFILFFTRLFENLICFQSLTLFSDDIQGIVFLLFSCNAALLGSFLLLKRLTMMANAISHTIVLGVVLAFYAYQNGAFLFLCGENAMPNHSSYQPDIVLLFVSTCVALFTGFLTQILAKFRNIQEDAANSIVFSSLFALGITLVSTLTKNAHAGVELLMGNPDALHVEDISHIAISTGISCIIVVLFFRGLLVAFFDPLFAKVSGFRPFGMVFLLLALVSITLVSSFRAVGFIMSLAFFVVPPLIARLFSTSLKTMLFISISVAAVTSLVAVALSRHLLSVHNLAVSTGALAVSLLACLYVFSTVLHVFFFKMRKKRCLNSLKEDKIID